METMRRWLEVLDDGCWSELRPGVALITFCPLSQTEGKSYYTGIPLWIDGIVTRSEFNCLTTYKVKRAGESVDICRHGLFEANGCKLKVYRLDCSKVGEAAKVDKSTAHGDCVEIMMGPETNVLECPKPCFVLVFCNHPTTCFWPSCFAGQPPKTAQHILTLPCQKEKPALVQKLHERLALLNLNDVLQKHYGFSDSVRIVRSIEGWFESNLLLAEGEHTIWLKITNDDQFTRYDAFEKRLAFQQYVASKKIISTPRLIPSVATGKLLVRLEGNLFCYAMEYTGDGSVNFSEAAKSSDTLTVSDYVPLAELLGKLHCSQPETLCDPSSVERLSKRTMDRDAKQLLSDLKARSHLLWDTEPENFDHCKMIIVSILAMRDACRMFGDCLPLGWNHADVHEFNVMCREDGELILIDYGDTLYGPLLVDLAFLLVRSLCFGKERSGSKTGFITLIQVYQRYRKMSNVELLALYPYCLGLLALSIIDGLESYGRDATVRGQRKLYLERSLRALKYCLFEPDLHDAVKYFIQTL